MKLNRIRTILFLGSLICASAQAETPSSSVTPEQANMIIRAWRDLNPALNTYCPVTDTRSMSPWFGKNSYLLLEETHTVTPGDLAIYFHPRLKAWICHRVVDVRPDGVLFDGINNKHSDGWMDPKSIKWRVVAIIYLKRS